MGKISYSYEQVFPKTLAYFQGDELAASCWLSKYALKDKGGRFLEQTPDDMHHRLAKAFSIKEKEYILKKGRIPAITKLSAYGQKRLALTEQKIYGYLKDFRYIIPQGSVMANLGNRVTLASLSNCIVLPPIHDSYGGILYTDQQLAQLFKRRCGVGIDISSLRPSGLFVHNAASSTSGAVSFMERFSNTTREVAQNGRRGALMITMDVAHPDIEQFVRIKQDLHKITGANVSVRISDEFMQAVAGGKSFRLRFPVNSTKPRFTRNIPAKELWNTIVNCAHQTAEPGIIFWDRQHTYSTSSLYPGFKNISTNPCSEIAMQGGDSCRLIAINLVSFVIHPFSPKAYFDFEKFHEVVYEAQRLMDNLVDLELETIERILDKIKKDPEPSTIKMVEKETWELIHANGKKGRRTGLGFTGLADTFASLGFVFDSDPAFEVAEQIMKTKCRAEFDSSIDMALERGAFKGFNPATEKKSGFVAMMKKEFPEQYTRMMKFGRRNISISTVAPTGTLSLLSRTSSGIEPVFMLSYKRRKKIQANDKQARTDFTDESGDAWQEFSVYHPGLKKWMDLTGEKEPEKSPYKGSTASEIDWLKRIRLQSIIQKYVTHSISSTINLPSGVTPEKTGEIYLEAWKQGLKGLTIYREGARNGVLIAEKENIAVLSKKESEPQAPARPAVLDAEVIRFLNGKEHWIAVIGLLKAKPYEIFTGKEDDSFRLPSYVLAGKVIKTKLPASDPPENRYDFQYTTTEGQTVLLQGLSRSFNSEYWNYAKLISGVLRQGMALLQVLELVKTLHLYDDQINTWKSGVARALTKFIPSGTRAGKSCPQCGDPDGIIYEEGCIKCISCGYSLCG
ncbi:MAG: adenosylcobalamin-dependent ribonucleoside-diphosphate reductase [Bacteroidia bacterium]